MMIADTDVLLDALRGKGAAERMRIEIATGQLATSVISVFELWSGARTDRDREAIERLLGALTLLPIEADDAREAAEIRREMEGRGLGIGTADYLIAGLCRRRSAMLITRNRSHFERVPGLKLTAMSV